MPCKPREQPGVAKPRKIWLFPNQPPLGKDPRLQKVAVWEHFFYFWLLGWRRWIQCCFNNRSSKLLGHAIRPFENNKKHQEALLMEGEDLHASKAWLLIIMRGPLPLGRGFDSTRPETKDPTAAAQSCRTVSILLSTVTCIPSTTLTCRTVSQPLASFVKRFSRLPRSV